jgi:hypothetical protein
MFQSTLLRRTMTLVIGALVASTFLTLVAFLLAGRNVTVNNEITRTLEQTRGISSAINEVPEYFNDDDFIKFFLDSSLITDKDIFILDGKKDILAQPSGTHRILDGDKTELAFKYIKESSFEGEETDGIRYVPIDSTVSGERILTTLHVADLIIYRYFLHPASSRFNPP